MTQRYDVVLFDLLTALLDSWRAWNAAAGSDTTGRLWRAQYLKLTYGCGAYQPYEKLVAQAAEDVGLSNDHALQLEANWLTLAPWPHVVDTLRTIKRTHRIGIVTNCSEQLGRAAAARLATEFDVIVTSERAGFYKPHPAPYELALKELGVSANRALFVAGSAYDLIGTHAVRVPTVWHNAVGLTLPQAVIDARVTAPLGEFSDFTHLKEYL
jgi:2-haloacid dehalogenase